MRETARGLQVGDRINATGKGKCAKGTLLRIMLEHDEMATVEYRCDYHQAYHLALLSKVRKITRPHQPKEEGGTQDE